MALPCVSILAGSSGIIKHYYKKKNNYYKKDNKKLLFTSAFLYYLPACGMVPQVEKVSNMQTTLEKKLMYDHDTNRSPWFSYMQNDGMGKTIPSGSIPLVESKGKLNKDRKDNEICFVLVRGEYGELQMGVFRVFFEDKRIRLRSDDPDYKDRIVNFEDVLCMHRVDGYIAFRDWTGFEVEND